MKAGKQEASEEARHGIFTPNPLAPLVICSFSTVDRRGCCRQETHYSDTLSGRNCGYIRVGVYGPRIWPVPPETTLGRRHLQQPARIHLPFSWKWPILDPHWLRGAAMCRATARRGATSCLETMPTLRSSPPQGGSPRCSARNPWLAASDGWSLQPPDRWDSACQPSSCSSHGSNLEADRLHRGPRLEPPIDGHVLCQTTQTSTNIATADICNVWVEMDNIFWSSVMWPPQLLAMSSEYEKPKGKCNPHWVIVHGDMASQRARCGQISSFVAFAIHVNGGKDKSLHESAQFCRQGFTLARFLCHLTCPLDTLSNHLAAGILLSIQAC